VAAPRKEKAYEKYAWIIFLVMGILLLVFSLVNLLMGNSVAGEPQLAWSVLVIAISLNSYRRGEKWAWYAFWILVVELSLFIIDERFWGDALVLVIVLLGLFLPFRKFFPKKQAQTP
jgi:hypothetical protein